MNKFPALVKGVFWKNVIKIMNIKVATWPYLVTYQYLLLLPNYILIILQQLARLVLSGRLRRLLHLGRCSAIRLLLVLGAAVLGAGLGAVWQHLLDVYYIIIATGI